MEWNPYSTHYYKTGFSDPIVGRDLHVETHWSNLIVENSFFFSLFQFAATSYGDAIRELDVAVGDILSTIVQIGIGNNTLVVFTSDNGAALVAKEMGEAGKL